MATPATPQRNNTATQQRILLSWSGGKDCAWALHLLRSEPRFAHYEVVGLLTTINQQFRRVAMHGFREELLDAQAQAAGLPLWKVPLPWPCSNAEYEAAMSAACARATAEGIHGVAFGDLFLEDVRAYRIAALAPTGLTPIFPCWGLDTATLARNMIRAGVDARLTCVDPQQIDARFAGRAFEISLLDELPATADPCGERGEFHSFVCAGPMLSGSIAVRAGEVVTRDGFVYADLLPG
jgi:diphthamide synthase (EF-2-diphthine--ammonia ligase)